MTFTKLELAEYTNFIVEQTVIAFSIALASLFLLNHAVSFGLWLYQRRQDKKSKQ